MNNHFHAIHPIGLALHKKGASACIVILMAWMAWTNPSPERLQATFGNRIEVSLNLVLFTLAIVSREPSSRQKPYDESVTHRLIDGCEFSEYHIGVFGKVF